MTARPAHPRARARRSRSGPFRVHPIRVAHSVARQPRPRHRDARPGVVLASGDFKIDADARRPTSAPTSRRSRPGATAACSCCSPTARTSSSPASPPARTTCVPAFEEILARTRGRVLVSCFATSIPRIQRVADLAARRTAAPVAFLGRRMVDNAEVAHRPRPAARSPSARGSPPAALARPAAGARCVFVSGSQGEPLSALSMISVGEHRDARGRARATRSCSRPAPIPGNERDGLAAHRQPLPPAAATSCTRAPRSVHVSGHGSQDDLARAAAPRAAALPRARPRRVPHAGPAQRARRARRASPPTGVLAGRGRRRARLRRRGRAQGGARHRRPRAARPRGRRRRSRTSWSATGGTSPSDGIVVPDRGRRPRRPATSSPPPEIVTRGFVDAGREAGAARRRRARSCSTPRWTRGPSRSGSTPT